MNIYLSIIASVSDNNKYLDAYTRLVSRALTRAPTKSKAKALLAYVEGHHILPRSFKLGGDNDSNNKVYLTAKEHILAHRLLCKFVNKPYLTSALRAYHCMCVKTNGTQNKRYATTHQLAIARESVKLANSVPRGIKGPPSWSNCNSLDEFEQLLSKHINNNDSDPVIASTYGVSATAVHNWRKKLNLDSRRPLMKDKDWLKHHYLTLCMSTEEIGQLVGATGAGVNLWLTKHGIPKRKGRRSNTPPLSH